MRKISPKYKQQPPPLLIKSVSLCLSEGPPLLLSVYLHFWNSPRPLAITFSNPRCTENILPSSKCKRPQHLHVMPDFRTKCFFSQERKKATWPASRLSASRNPRMGSFTSMPSHSGTLKKIAVHTVTSN